MFQPQLMQNRAVPQRAPDRVAWVDPWALRPDDPGGGHGDHRVEIAVPVQLHFRDGAFAHGLATNLSTGGVFVETQLWESKDGCVDIRLHAPGPSGESSIRIPAFVVQESDDGLGLMFRHLDSRAENFIRGLLARAAAAGCVPPRQV